MSYSNKKYASLYDLIYKNKNYLKEVNFLTKQFKIKNKKAKKVLDLGCGTGQYTYLLSKKGYEVTGVDISKSMIEIAKKKYKTKKNINFIHKDLKKINLKNKFDIVVALFDVLSFQNSKSEIERFFKVLSKHLKKGGLVFFDFWYKNTIVKLKPASRAKKIENKIFKILKTTKPTWIKKQNIVKVYFKLLIEKKMNRKIETVNGVHIMKYYSLAEINKYLKKHNFKILRYGTLLSNKIKKNSWSIYSMARKV